MKVYKCDRCGNFFEKKIEHGENFYITKLPHVPNSFLDLCPTCNNELKEWFAITNCKVESEGKE